MRTMKQLFLATCFLASASFLHAQSVNFGLKGGLNLATWSNNNSGVGYQNRTGYHVGGLAQVNLSPNFAIQPEVVYSNQGTKYSFDNVEHNLSLNYVNIPVMLQAKIGGGLYAQAGPQIGFLTGVNDKANDFETGFFSKSDFKSTDVALGVGLGYEGASGMGIDARYNLGLSNINNAGTNAIKNNTLQLGLFLKFNGGNRR